MLSSLLIVKYCLLWYIFLFQVVDYLIDPFVAGTSAGDPGSLSVSTYTFLINCCIS